MTTTINRVNFIKPSLFTAIYTFINYKLKHVDSIN